MLSIILIIGIIFLLGHFFAKSIVAWIIVIAPVLILIYLFKNIGLSEPLIYFFTFILFVLTIVGIYGYFNEESKYYRYKVKCFKFKIQKFSNEQKQNEIKTQEDFLLTYIPNKKFYLKSDKRKYDLEFKICKKYIKILQNINSDSINILENPTKL